MAGFLEDLIQMGKSFRMPCPGALLRDRAKIARSHPSEIQSRCFRTPGLLRDFNQMLPFRWSN